MRQPARLHCSIHAFASSPVIVLVAFASRTSFSSAALLPSRASPSPVPLPPTTFNRGRTLAIPSSIAPCQRYAYPLDRRRHDLPLRCARVNVCRSHSSRRPPSRTPFPRAAQQIQPPIQPPIPQADAIMNHVASHPTALRLPYRSRRQCYTTRPSSPMVLDMLRSPPFPLRGFDSNASADRPPPLFHIHSTHNRRSTSSPLFPPPSPPPAATKPRMRYVPRQSVRRSGAGAAHRTRGHGLARLCPALVSSRLLPNPAVCPRIDTAHIVTIIECVACPGWA
ncbi:hypothetical protein K438DRAFT_1808594 [Mycena galopus ATCC 62051]|nr:hypothetical protein K438DRAFT_1808594 [Mycena galopus ATCC 62051]